jgi:HSP20 family protein
MALFSTMSPWAALSDLQREMNQLMRTVFGGSGLTEIQRPTHPARTWTPAVDVFSQDGNLVVRAEIPGVDPEKDVDIQVADGVLTIRGQRKAQHRDEGANYFRMETSYGAFERSIPLPDGVNADDIEATHRQGILEVVVPGAARIAPARKVPVQIEDTASPKAIATEGSAAEGSSATEGSAAEGSSETNGSAASQA